MNARLDILCIHHINSRHLQVFVLSDPLHFASIKVVEKLAELSRIGFFCYFTVKDPFAELQVSHDPIVWFVIECLQVLKGGHPNSIRSYGFAKRPFK